MKGWAYFDEMPPRTNLLVVSNPRSRAPVEMDRVDLYLVALMTRRDLFSRFIGAPIAAVGALSQQSQRFPKAIAYWTETVWGATGARSIGTKFFTDNPEHIRNFINSVKKEPTWKVFSEQKGLISTVFYRWKAVQ